MRASTRAAARRFAAALLTGILAASSPAAAQLYIQDASALRDTDLYAIDPGFYDPVDPVSPDTTSDDEPAMDPTLQTDLQPALQDGRWLQDVDALERAAHAAQRDYVDVFRPARNSLDGLRERVMAHAWAEGVLEAAYLQAWDAVALADSEALLVHEPLFLAALELQTKLRRHVGPYNGTEVPGLHLNAGCAGDLIGDRLVVRYAANTAAALATTQAASAATVATLEAIARQTVCLGGEQLLHLEIVMTGGFHDVVERMRGRGLDALVPAFARLMAPVQLLILDAVKHRGARSATWQWFARYGDEIRAAVDHSGWPTGEIFLWDRRNALLVGHERCVPGAAADCVDVQTLLHSVEDPVAVGLGDCGLVSTATLPVAQTSAGPRYVCPPRACEDARATITSVWGRSYTYLTPLRTEDRAELQSRWPDLDENDFSEISGFCREDAVDYQAGHRDVGACLDAELVSPFDAYASCVAEGIGVGELPDLDESYPGVPFAESCALADMFDPDVPDLVDQVRKAKRRARRAIGNALYRVLDGIESTGERWARTIGDGLSWLPEMQSDEDGTKTSEPTGTEPTAATEPEPDPLEELLDISAILADDGSGAPDDDYFDGLLRLQQTARRMGDKEFEAQVESWLEDVTPTIEELLEQIRREDEEEQLDGSGSTMRADCIDEFDCGNACNGTAVQMDAAKECGEALLQQVAAALGLKDREDVDEWSRFHVYPNPEAEVGDDGSWSCLGDLESPELPALCGLILCPDASLSSVLGGECACDSGGVGAIPVQRVCELARCADGTLPDENCLCQEWTEGAPPPPPPGPMSEGL